MLSAQDRCAALWSPSPTPASAPLGTWAGNTSTSCIHQPMLNFMQTTFFEKSSKGFLQRGTILRLQPVEPRHLKSFAWCHSAKWLFPRNAPKQHFWCLQKLVVLQIPSKKMFSLLCSPKKGAALGGGCVDQLLGCHSHCGPADVSHCPCGDLDPALAVAHEG